MQRKLRAQLPDPNDTHHPVGLGRRGFLFGS